MANLTLAIPEQLKQEMDKHKDIRWSKAIRSIIENKLNDFKETERIFKKSQLTQADVDRFSAQVNEAAGRHAKELLHESRSRR